MKCVTAVQSKENEEAQANSLERNGTGIADQYDIIVLGGLTGRLDQTIHTLSYLHKLRKSRKTVYAVADENVGWVLDSVRPRQFCVLITSPARNSPASRRIIGRTSHIH
jgi:thiamine pyrophosphokinase